MGILGSTIRVACDRDKCPEILHIEYPLGVSGSMFHVIAVIAVVKSGWEVGDEKWWCFHHRPNDSERAGTPPVKSTRSDA